MCATMHRGESHKLLADEYVSGCIFYIRFICFANAIKTEATVCHFPETGKSI